MSTFGCSSRCAISSVVGRRLKRDVAFPHCKVERCLVLKIEAGGIGSKAEGKKGLRMSLLMELKERRKKGKEGGKKFPFVYCVLTLLKIFTCCYFI